jgi:hypothetical protein
MAGARAYWFHVNLGEGDASIRDLLHHGGEISQILGAHGLPGLDIWLGGRLEPRRAGSRDGFAGR